MTEALVLSRVIDVLRDAGLLAAPGDFADVPIRRACQDSRDAEPGDIFLAWQGTRFDAHEYVQDAVESGAVAAVVERLVPEVSVPQVVVTDGRRAAALVADLVSGSPWRRMLMVGVTGTNGKTTTVHLLRQLLGRRYSAASIGTLGVVGPDGKVQPGTEGLTTPGPVAFSRWLRSLYDHGVEAVAVEASSHALEQERLAGVRFDVAVYTNLTQDHLDYHPDLDEYRDAKVLLAGLLKSDAVVVVNADEPAWDVFRGSGLPRVSYGRAPDADLRVSQESWDASGSAFTLTWDGQETRVSLPLPGAFNVENAAAAACAALQLGLSLDEVSQGLREVRQVRGRLERVLADPFTAIIDFAHTPAALERVIATLRPLTEGRLVVLFGAGGDRDRGKRPLMARAASAEADLLVLTSDNPRTEDPEAILDQVEAGVEGVPFVRMADRAEAIRWALEQARPGDVILLAGKGHETYQVVGEEKRPFDEVRIVREWAEGRDVS